MFGFACWFSQNLFETPPPPFISAMVPRIFVYTVKNSLSVWADSTSTKRITTKPSYCPHRASHNANLQKHMKIHDSVRQYFQCQKCPRKFTEETNLTAHKKEFHVKYSIVHNQIAIQYLARKWGLKDTSKNAMIPMCARNVAQLFRVRRAIWIMSESTTRIRWVPTQDRLPSVWSVDA
jgi:transposase-like protein